MLTKIFIRKCILFLSLLFTFGGYYFVLGLVANFGYLSSSQVFTAPLRVLIVSGLFFILLASPRKIIKNNTFYCFVLFSVAYLARTTVEIVTPGSPYHIVDEFFLYYFLSFFFIPYLLISGIFFTEDDYDIMFLAIIIGSLLLSIVVYYYYGHFLGQVSRISSVISKDDNYLSPLAMSYVSSMTIGVSIFYLIENKVSFYKKLIIVVSILAALVPFLLGASRGSALALFIPFIIYFPAQKRWIKFNWVFLLVPLAFGLVIFSESQGSGVFERLLNIERDINTGSSSVIRIKLWMDGIKQFINSPIFGSGLNLETVNFHPHNIFIEVLITTGIIGFIPFLIFIGLVFRKAFWIARYRPNKYWLVVVFIQAFTQHMFSGGIYAASWLAVGSALVIGYRVNSSQFRFATATNNNRCAKESSVVV